MHLLHGDKTLILDQKTVWKSTHTIVFWFQDEVMKSITVSMSKDVKMYITMSA